MGPIKYTNFAGIEAVLCEDGAYERRKEEAGLEAWSEYLFAQDKDMILICGMQLYDGGWVKRTSDG